MISPCHERLWFNIHVDTITVKPVYKGNSGEPEKVAFMSICPLHVKNICIYTLFINGGEMRLPFIDIGYIKVPCKAGLTAYLLNVILIFVCHNFILRNLNLYTSCQTNQTIVSW